MSIRFGEIYLYSHDIQKLFGFISFLLDVEASFVSDEAIKFEFQRMTFVIVHTDKKRIDKTKYFSLYVESANELNDIKQNIEFYHYKESNQPGKIAVSDSSLSFSDPDGRQWQVCLAPVITEESFKKDLTLEM
jgi:hypothetical protein